MASLSKWEKFGLLKKKYCQETDEATETPKGTAQTLSSTGD